MSDSGVPDPFRLARSAAEEVVERVRGVAEALAATTSAATRQGAQLGAPVPRAVSDLLGSMTHLASAVPSPAAQLELVLQELKAKRALVQALVTQLESFDAQLEFLERSLEPLQGWTKQWASVTDSLASAAGTLLPGGRRAEPDEPRR